MGARITYIPSPTRFSFHLISGISSRIVWREYVYGSSLDGDIGTDDNFFLIILDAGLGADYAINKTFRLRLGGLAFIPFREEKMLPTNGYGYSLKLVVDYFIE